MKKPKIDKSKENIKLRRQYDLSEIKRSNVPMPPVRKFEIGQKVIIGNLWDCRIYRTHDDGKFYDVLIIHRSRPNWSNAEEDYVYTSEIRPVLYTDIIPYSTYWNERLSKNDDIYIQYQQRHLEGILNLYYCWYGIDINPEYQRGLVWTQAQKLDLINSIFNNIEIGKFTIIKREYQPEGKMYEILDGKQRLMALVEFHTDQFRYKGLLFSEMHPRDRNHFEDYAISYGESNPMTLEQKYRYFLKLNTAGTPMAKEHIDKIRNEYYKMIKEN